MNLAEPIRAALIDDSVVGPLLATYKNSKAVFTRRPAPADAPELVIMIGPDVSISDQDGIDDDRPVIVRDVAIYGPNEPASSYRAVETLGYAVRDAFHRRHNVLDVAGWGVIDIVAAGPTPAPTDDEQTVGRRVELTVRLARRS